MYVTVWIWGIVSMTLGDPTMSADMCEVLKARVTQDITQAYIQYPELMFQDGEPVPRESIWATCENKELELGFEDLSNE